MREEEGEYSKKKMDYEAIISNLSLSLRIATTKSIS